MRRTFCVSGALAAASFAAIILMRRWVSLLVFGSEEQADLVVLSAGSLITIIAFNSLCEWFTALRNIRLVSVMQLVNSVIFAVLSVILLLSWQCTVKSVLLSYSGACLISALWAGVALRRVWHVAPASVAPLSHTIFWARVAPFAAWVLLGNALSSLFGVLDRYLIVHFSRLSPAEALDMVGNYHSSRVVPLLLVSIATMLAVMIVPHLSHDWESGRRDLVAFRLRLFVKIFGFALFAGAVAVLLAGPLLFQVAFRGKFPGGQAVLPWTLVYCTWFGLLMVLQNYLLCAEKAGLTSVALACGLALNVPLNLTLLPRFGLAGAVLATAAANALSLLMICMFNRRLGFHLDDGVKLILALPMLVCLGPWVAMLALVVVAADALWGDRLLSAEEKHVLAEGITLHSKRYGLDRIWNKFGRRAVGR